MMPIGISTAKSVSSSAPVQLASIHELMNLVLGFPVLFQGIVLHKGFLGGDNIINHFIINVQLEIIFSDNIPRKPLQNLFIASEANILWPEIISRIYSVPLPELAAGLPISANTSLCL